jgi:inner membrane transporter RhtA
MVAMVSFDSPALDRGDIGLFERLPPELLFVLSAISQYTGAVIAKRLFDEVAPGTVVLFRVLSAALALCLVSKAWNRRWTREDLKAAALFGLATATMNLCFYLALDRLDLGVGVAIEFIGPIAVAAARTRTQRNAMALLSATIGVLVLAGLEFSGGDPLGLLFMLGASACWAGYIVLGSRVARKNEGLSGLGVGLLIGTIVTIPLGVSGVGTVLASPRLFILCCCVGMFSTAIGYGIDQFVLQRMSTRRFALMTALLPVTAVLAGLLFLDERLGSIDLAGIGLVLLGVIIQERDQ